MAIKYGENGFAGSASDVGAQRTRAGLTVNNDDSDPVLNRIKASGAKRNDAVQAKPIRSAMGNKVPGPNPTVPGSIVRGDPVKPVRQPG